MNRMISQKRRKGYYNEGRGLGKKSSNKIVIKKASKVRARSRDLKPKKRKSSSKLRLGDKGLKKRSLSKSKSIGGDIKKCSLIFKSENLKNNKYWKIMRKGKVTVT